MALSGGITEWLPTPPKKNTPDLIMTLPAELRNHIYELALVRDSECNVFPGFEYPVVVRRGILKASKQIRSEALPIFYGNNSFHIWISMDSVCFLKISRWLNRVVKRRGPRPFKDITYHIDSIALIDLPDSLDEKIIEARPLVEAAHESGVDLVCDDFIAKYGRPPLNKTLEHAGTVFVSRKTRGWAVDRKDVRYCAALAQALQLGKRAHDEQWSREKLNSGFDGRLVGYQLQDASNTSAQDRARVPPKHSAKERHTQSHLEPAAGAPQPIYHLVLPKGEKRWLTANETPEVLPAILLTCKQIQTEALPVYYGANWLTCGVTVESGIPLLATAVERLRAVIEVCGPTPFAGFTIHLMQSPIWEYLMDFLPLLELIRDTGFEPATQTYQVPTPRSWGRKTRHETDTSTFIMPQAKMGVAQFVLEKAVSLARRARAEGWDAKRLAKRFKEIAALQEKPSQRKKMEIVVEGKAL